MFKIDGQNIHSSAKYKTENRFELILKFQLTKQSHKSTE